MRLPMAIGSGIVMVLGIAIAPGAAGQPKGPDEGRKVYRVQLKDSTRFPKWKVAAFKGTADEKGDHFLLDKLTTLQPVVISLLPGNKDDDIKLAVYKDGKSGFTLVRSLEGDALAKDIVLPALAAGERYRVQGTFSTCKDSGVCVLESQDRILVASPGENRAVLELRLN